MQNAQSYNDGGQDYNDNSHTLYNSIYYSPDLSGKCYIKIILNFKYSPWYIMIQTSLILRWTWVDIKIMKY